MSHDDQTAAVRAVFDKAVEESTDSDQRATRELLREYFTNPTFREAMAAEIARINGVGGNG